MILMRSMKLLVWFWCGLHLSCKDLLDSEFDLCCNVENVGKDLVIPMYLMRLNNMTRQFNYLCIKAGCCYWEITATEYGTDFRIAPTNRNVCFAPWDIKAVYPRYLKEGETLLELNNGKKYAIRNEHIVYVYN